MITLLHSLTELVNASPWAVGEFTVTDKPVIIRAFGLGATDLVCIQAVEKVQVGSPHITATDCTIELPKDMTIRTVADLLEGGKKICLCDKQPWLIVGLSGNYQLLVSGTNITNKAVTVTADTYIGESHALLTYCQTCGNP